MADNINSPNLKIEAIDKNLFPCLSNITKKVSETGEFESCPILSKKHTVHDTRGDFQTPYSSCKNYEGSLKVSAKPLHSFVSKFVSSMEFRFDKEKGVNGVLINAGNLFDVRKIVDYKNSDEIERDLIEFADLAKSSGNLDFQVTDNNELLSEYEIFANRNCP